MSYLEKYLKYKTKYMALKYQIGGNLNCDEINFIFDLMDTNKDNNISESEFKKFFMAADADNSKTVSLVELQSYLNRLLKDLFEVLKFYSGTKQNAISLSNINTVFDKMDTTKDGKINSLEFASALKTANITDTKNMLFKFLSTSSQIGIEKAKFNNIIKTIITASDKNKDNSVSKDEFVKKINSIASDVFKALDSNNDGNISEAELTATFKSAAGADLQLSKEEFRLLMVEKKVSNCDKM